MYHLLKRFSVACSLMLAGMLGSGAVAASVLSLPLESQEPTAEVYYVAPNGSSTADGRTPATAISLSRLSIFIQKLKTSAKVILLPGEYPITKTLDLWRPTNEHLLVLEGPGAILKGTYDFSNESVPETGFRLRTGNIVLRGLGFENTKICVKADKSSVIDQVLIEDMAAKNVHSCLLVDNDVKQEVSRWIVRNSRIEGYYRVGIRLAGAKTHDFLIDDVLVDGAHPYATSDCFKGGIQLLAGVSNVHVRNTTVRNNIGSCGEEYQQGDAIEADHKKGTPTNLRFENLTVSNSGDGAFDLKASGVSMSNILVMGGELTRYAFKVWEYKDYECHNCVAYGLNKAFINLNEAHMKFTRATFSNDEPVQVCDLRRGETEETRSVVTFEDSRIYVGSEEWAAECGADALATVERLPQGKFIPPSPVMKIQIR